MSSQRLVPCLHVGKLFSTSNSSTTKTGKELVSFHHWVRGERGEERWEGEARVGKGTKKTKDSKTTPTFWYFDQNSLPKNAQKRQR